MIDITLDIAALFILVFGAIGLGFSRKHNSSTFHYMVIMLVLGTWYCFYDCYSYLYLNKIVMPPRVVINTLLTLYFVSIAYYPYTLFRLIDHFTIRDDRVRHVLLAIPFTVCTVLILIVNPFTNFIFHLWPNEGVTAIGPGFIILDYNWAFYLIVCSLLLVKEYRKLGKVRTIIFISAEALCLLGRVLQSFFPRIMITSVGISFSATLMIVFFFYLDNSIDRLTGLCGKEGFFRETAALIGNNPRITYVLVCADVRHLRDINERYGFAVGDQVLQQMGKLLQTFVGAGGVVGRLEADDFAFCIPQDISDHFPTEMECVLVTSSGTITRQFDLYYGIYTVTNPSMTVDLMCDRAGYALESIRGNYKLHFAVFQTEMEDRIREVRLMENDMKVALEEHQFHVYYQPIYNLSTREIASAEALVRWIHPQEGLISPGKFIPLFEQDGFINQLEEYVLRQVCDDLTQWRKQNLRYVPISINLARSELEDQEHIQRMQDIILHAGISFDDILIEITEGAFSKDTGQLIDELSKIRSEGFKILMDDFGSGFSSLSMFKDMPVDVVKIDMRFLEKNDSYERGRNILRYIILMAQSVKIPVIVEGVETREQEQFLADLQCELVQGFLFARPMPGGNYAQMLG